MRWHTEFGPKDPIQFHQQSYRQFHQHFTGAFFLQHFGAEKFQTQNTAVVEIRANFMRISTTHSFVNFVTKILYKKCVLKMLIKLTPGRKLVHQLYDI